MLIWSAWRFPSIGTLYLIGFLLFLVVLYFVARGFWHPSPFIRVPSRILVGGFFGFELGKYLGEDSLPTWLHYFRTGEFRAGPPIPAVIFVTVLFAIVMTLCFDKIKR